MKRLPQQKQWLRGVTTERPAGSRKISTLTKLPTLAPNRSAPRTATSRSGSTKAYWLRESMIATSGRNIATTMNPTMAPRITIMIGSRAAVRDSSIASTSLS